MKIGILWHGTYPWDIRIEKMARSFIASGHETVIIAKGAPDMPSREFRDGALIVRLYARRRSRLLAKYLSLPLFFNPYWWLALCRTARKEKLDIIIVRDLPLAFLAAMAGRRLLLPVVLDMAENYPAALLSYQRKLYAPFLFGNAWLPRAYERISLRFIDRVVVVAEEQKERLERAGIAGAKIALVRNTPDCGYLRKLSGAPTDENAVGGRYILYSGFIDRHRGIRTLVLAFNEIKERYADLKLVLIGSGRELSSLRELARELKIEDRVLFTGWLDFSRVPAYIRDSTLCVIPHLRTEHTETTLPNKIFDYLYFDKPLVVSDAAPLVRIVQESQGGHVFKSGDHRDLARALASALNGEGKGTPGAARGRALIERKYNWENDARVLLQVVNARRASDEQDEDHYND